MSLLKDFITGIGWRKFLHCHNSIKCKASQVHLRWTCQSQSINLVNCYLRQHIGGGTHPCASTCFHCFSFFFYYLDWKRTYPRMGVPVIGASPKIGEGQLGVARGAKLASETSGWGGESIWHTTSSVRRCWACPGTSCASKQFSLHLDACFVWTHDFSEWLKVSRMVMCLMKLSRDRKSLQCIPVLKPLRVTHDILTLHNIGRKHFSESLRSERLSKS